ncbi:MAG: peptide chain release factor N(5)-glutamine methyltransferase [Desulfobacteraceae bacterium]|nr:peptide chain release factor N(5)-glutamine methyltransferase [Desulfobacteraceae bacterium]
MAGDQGPWTIKKILDWTDTYFKSHDIDSPRLAAEILLSHCLDVRRLDLYLQHDRPLNPDELASFRELIKRRISREPVAYITGSKGFWESDFKVAPGVLIPRPDTEVLVEAALKVLAKGGDKPLRVLELGVGSGAVIVSLARSNPEFRCVACDLSLTALGVASSNAAMEPPCPNLSFVAGSWFTPFRPKAQFDLIVSNPPYIPTRDIETLQPEINRYEPLLALDGGPDGLDCIRTIMAEACDYLVPGGTLLLETGSDQREGVDGIFKNCREFASIEFIDDYAGLHRVVKLEKKIANSKPL